MKRNRSYGAWFVILAAVGLVGSAGAEVHPGEKLARVIVPRVEMVKAPMADALEFLRIRSEDLDTTVPAGKVGRGVNFILKDPGGELAEVEVTLTLNRVPLKTVLDYIVRFAGATYRIDSRAVVIGKAQDLEDGIGLIVPGRLDERGKKIFSRLRDTRLPAVGIENATLDEAISYFRAVSGGDGGGGKEAKGLNFVFKNPAEPLPQFSLQMKNVPLGTALRYACELSGVVYAIHPNAVVIGAPEDFIAQPKDPGAHAYGRRGILAGGRPLAAKLKTLVIPRVELRSASIEDALDLIRGVALSAESKAGVVDPRGVNLVNLAQDNAQRITLSLAEIPAWELLGYVTALTDTEFRVDRLAVLIDWKLPRRTTVKKKAEGAVGQEAPIPRFERPSAPLQVPILDRDPFGVVPGGRVDPFVVPSP